MPIFRVKSVKIYTGQKNLHWRRRPRRRQLSGMAAVLVTEKVRGRAASSIDRNLELDQVTILDKNAMFTLSPLSTRAWLPPTTRRCTKICWILRRRFYPLNQRTSLSTSSSPLPFRPGNAVAGSQGGLNVNKSWLSNNRDTNVKWRSDWKRKSEGGQGSLLSWQVGLYFITETLNTYQVKHWPEAQNQWG